MSEQSWHQSPDMVIRKCSNRDNCRYGGEVPHFNTEEEGVAHLEKVFEETSNSPQVSRKKEKPDGLSEKLYSPTLEALRQEHIQAIRRGSTEELNRKIKEKTTLGVFNSYLYSVRDGREHLIISSTQHEFSDDLKAVQDAGYTEFVYENNSSNISLSLLEAQKEGWRIVQVVEFGQGAEFDHLDISKERYPNRNGFLLEYVGKSD